MNSKDAQILLIEDENDLRIALAELLEDEGYTVAQAKDGKQGLDYLRTNQHPQLIILDFMMPIMDGEEFCLNLNQDDNLKLIPVALVTAASISPEKLIRMNVDCLIQKPLGISHFLEYVEKHFSIKAE